MMTAGIIIISSHSKLCFVFSLKFIFRMNLGLMLYCTEPLYPIKAQYQAEKEKNSRIIIVPKRLTGLRWIRLLQWGVGRGGNRSAMRTCNAWAMMNKSESERTICWPSMRESFDCDISTFSNCILIMSSPWPIPFLSRISRMRPPTILQSLHFALRRIVSALSWKYQEYFRGAGENHFAWRAKIEIVLHVMHFEKQVL